MCGPNGENNNQASRFWLSVSSHLENDMEEVRHTQTSKSPPAISRMAGSLPRLFLNSPASGSVRHGTSLPASYRSE